MTPLMWACKRGCVAPVIKALVEKGADVDLVDDSGMTAVGWAINHEDEIAALYLLTEAGAAAVEGSQ